MKLVGAPPKIPEACYREAMALPLVNGRRPYGATKAIAAKYGIPKPRLQKAMRRGMKRYDIAARAQG